MIREPAVAGQFYENDVDKLKKQIKNCFTHKLGPGLPKKQNKKRIFAAIVPHAGYLYSGPCAAHVYKEIAEAEKVDTFVIIGPNHNGIGASIAVYPDGKWKTPLGVVDVDSELAKEVLLSSKFASADTTAHAREHSIEVQIPFLQYVYKDFKILPICTKGIHVLKESNDLVEALLNASFKLGRKIMIIASSDFTHQGPLYMYTPFKGTKSYVQKKIIALDKKMILFIEKLKEIELLKNIIKNNATICGYAPITVAIIYARSVKCKSGKLLKFYTSGEITKDFENTVSYAGIIFK